ncbi:hypothetical protein CAEBREN_06071 [Caenorhabditis brenneri]|uniref:Uncharacterized protein n=1 Tax=Caenorhabditis brenneri TaxID=135651 RepID=G0MYD6_CAEBE|nr:hypothetical protein CAEBREN_06071 [Caenorhabditis brenneri]
MHFYFCVKNYKAIKMKNIFFDNPLIVFSSGNGGGKSSIVEGMGICLGLTKDAFRINSLRELIRDEENQCSLKLMISEGHRETFTSKTFEVKINRNKERNVEYDEDLYEEHETGGSRKRDEKEDDDSNFVEYFIDEKKVTYEEYLTEIKVFGTNNLSTALSVVNHQIINRSPDDDSKLYDYLMAMSGIKQWERSSEYETYTKSRKQADRKIMFLGKQEEDLEKERSLTRLVYYLRLFLNDEEIKEQKEKLKNSERAGHTSRNGRHKLLILKQKRLKYLHLMKANKMELKLKKGSLHDLARRSSDKPSKSYSDADIKTGDTLVIDFMPLRTHFEKKLTKNFANEKIKSLSNEVDKIAVDVTYKNKNPTLVFEKEQTLEECMKQFKKIRDKIERKFEEEDRKKAEQFKRFLANVSRRFQFFFKIFYDNKDVEAELRMGEEPQEVELHIKNTHGTKTTFSALSGGEKRVAQLVLSFAILGEKNVPLALVDNADVSFFKDNGRRMLDFCKKVLANSESMKNIVLVGNDPHNFLYHCKQDRVRILDIVSV